MIKIWGKVIAKEKIAKSVVVEVDEEGKETVVEEGYYHINGTPINFDLMNVNIIINAYGIQAATFDNVEEAYAAYNAQADATTDNVLPADID